MQAVKKVAHNWTLKRKVLNTTIYECSTCKWQKLIHHNLVIAGQDCVRFHEDHTDLIGSSEEPRCYSR